MILRPRHQLIRFKPVSMRREILYRLQVKEFLLRFMMLLLSEARLCLESLDWRNPL
jgi:hypothetical protein